MLPFDIVDVFADQPFAGNQLAVVHGADDLDPAQCLAIAREFGFAETTFPASSVDGAEYATRIFTPGGEIPFAGHPTLGTAWVLRSRGVLPQVSEVTQVCGAGRIRVRFDGEDGGLVELTALPRELSGPLDGKLLGSLLRDLGLFGTDVAGPVRVAGCGLNFVHVPVVEGALARAHVSSRPLADHDDRFETDEPVEGVNVVEVSGAAPELAVRARVFVPGLSVPEDAATGSAAVGLGMALVASGRLPDGGRYQITQGVEMGRPSRLLGRVEAAGGVATSCQVAGKVHAVGRGEIAVPRR